MLTKELLKFRRSVGSKPVFINPAEPERQKLASELIGVYQGAFDSRMGRGEIEELTDVQTQSLSDVIDYAVRAEKTTVTPDDESTMVVRQFISGINCLPSTARDEMLAVKKRFGKEDGVIAYHGYQSFAPGEATPELAHEIGVKLAQRLWGERYQVLVATHLDKENHLHNHFVLNTVSFVDGIKYHRTEKDYHDMRTVSDTLCREYNLSVIQRPQAGKSKHYGEWRAEQEQRPTWRGLIRSEIDELIRQSVTEKQFYYLLRQKGYEVKFGKDISVRPPGKERFVRLTRNFGEAYTAEAIRQRILQQPLPQPERQMTDKPRPKPTASKAAGKLRARSPAFAHCISFTATSSVSSPKAVRKTGRGSIFCCGKICSN